MTNKKSIVLAKRAKRGNLKAFKALCNLKAPYIADTAFEFLKNYQDAEDVAQETFIKMFKTIHLLKKPETLDSWIYRIVRYNSMRRIQKRKAQGNDHVTPNRTLIPVRKDDAQIEQIVARLAKLYTGSQGLFTGESFMAAKAFLARKIIIGASLAILLAIGGLGINYLMQSASNNNIAALTAAQGTALEGYGEITFFSAENKTSQINPVGAGFNKHDGEAVNVHWVIIDKKTKTIIYGGEGATVTDVFSRIEAQGKTSKYILKFYYEDTSGQKYTESREFTIKK